jgi:uncharacterized Zn-finger protein
MKAPVIVQPQDLNGHGGVFCPNPKASMDLWNSHPKVFLDVARTGQAQCPYCGTRYQLPEGVKAAAH